MEDTPLSITEHLAELRSRLIICLSVLIITTIGTYINIKTISAIIIKPIENLVFISPLELLISYIKLAIICGFLLASPVILFHIWKFTAKALTHKERKYIYIYVPFSLILFFAGAAFAYFLVVPAGIKMLLGLATPNIQPMISIAKYISFLGLMVFTFSIVFQVPLVIIFLTSIKLLNPNILKTKRKYAYLLTFIIAALITPPDVFTQILLACPLILLYEISILLTMLIYKKKAVPK